MKITDLSIKYRTSVMVFTLLVVLGGLYSYLTIPKESQPSIEIPLISITTVYPGVSPDDIESLITQPIENEVQSVSGIKEIRSTSAEGVSSINVEFDTDVSIEDAYQKVREKVDIAKSKLPSDVEEPMVNEIDFSAFPIMTVNLAANYSLTRLKATAEDLQDEIEKEPGVLGVDLIGGLEREVQIQVDLNALKGYNIAFNDVINAIRNENMNIPGGSIDIGRFNYLVRVSGEFSTPAEIENLVVKKKDNAGPIYVRDVATVVYGYKKRSSYSRLRVFREEDDDDNLYELPAELQAEMQVISLNIKKQSGENILSTVDGVNAAIDEFNFPEGTQVVITGDQSEQVKILVRNLENNIISGILFVIVVLLFFLGVRNAVLVGIAIPLSMFVSFIMFQAFGYTLNFIILFSLIIALGMLVDNAIVIVENIYRYHEEGHGKFESARLATAEVGGAVVASTATTLAVFIPMMFWPGIMGQFMGYMPLTLIFTLSSSLFVALVINPVVTGYFIKLDDEQGYETGTAAKWFGRSIVVIFALVIGFSNLTMLMVLAGAGIFVYVLNHFVLDPAGKRFTSNTLPKMVDGYRNFLHWVLERDYTVKLAYWRNAFSVGSLALGVLMLILGAVISSLAGEMSGMVLMFPGMIIAGLGLVALVVHFFEAIYRAGKMALFATVGFALTITGIFWINTPAGGSIDLPLLQALLIFPGVIGIIAALGWVAGNGKPLIITDNRALLMNVTIGALFMIFGMYASAPTGDEFFPNTDPQLVRVKIKGSLGTNIETSNQVSHSAMDRLANLMSDNDLFEQNIRNLLVNVGTGGDSRFGGGSSSAESSVIAINFIDYDERVESSSASMERLRNELLGIPGASIEIEKQENGPPTGAPVNIEVTGNDFAVITRISQEIRDLMEDAARTDSIKGLVDIRDNLNTGRPQLSVIIDREKAALYKLNTGKIANTIRSAINGTEAGKFRDGEDDYDITVRLQEADRASLESLRNLTILHEGQQIPIVSVASFDIGAGLGSITRLDQKRVVTVQANIAPGFNGNAVLAEVQAMLVAYEQTIPAGYALNYTGASEEQAEAFGFLGTALLIGVSLIFMILIAQFNRITAPFLIMVAVGLSLIGVMLGLVLTRTPFGLMTFIGVISLAGIVVNNAIVLVDYILQLQAKGYNKLDSIVHGGATRLRPVLLTALTTVLGLIPLTFGINIDFIGLLTDANPAIQFGSENTQFWGPMGTAIISGLTFATFLTLVIVPVMFSLFDSLSDSLGKVFGRGDAIILATEAGAVSNSESTAPAPTE